MRLLTLLLLAASAYGQTFDVASIRQVQNVQTLGYGSEKIVANPGALAMHNVRLRAAIRWAYDLKEYQVSAPEWMGSPGYQGREMGRFEIIAKAEGAPIDQLRVMLQHLLAERFHLAVHRESREMPVYVLTYVKDRPGLKPADDTSAESTASGNDRSFTMHHTTLSQFAEFLAGPLQTPIVDRTAHSGAFEITVDLTRYHTESTGNDFSVLPHALEDQLGLKLERQKLPIEILVIDHADAKPTEN